VKDLRCDTLHLIPYWLGDYIESLAEALHRFDLIEFENVRAGHIQYSRCACAGISNQDIRAFWDALTAVVHGVIEQADSTLALVKEEPTEKSDPPSVPLRLTIPDADIILRSSDQVNFRVRESFLAMSSESFEDLLSLSQPPDGELVDGLPVVQLSEDAGLLISLISLLYPISPVIPDSYEKVFALLAACQKYDMASIQSAIRAEIKRGAFPAPVGTEAFRGYAIASSMGLIPEMESAARLTLSYPMTFESLGEGLRSFNGRELCSLVRYRKRCIDNLVSCLDSFFDVRSRCQIWEGCQQEFSGLPGGFFAANPDTPPSGWGMAKCIPEPQAEGGWTMATPSSPPKEPPCPLPSKANSVPSKVSSKVSSRIPSSVPTKPSSVPRGIPGTPQPPPGGTRNAPTTWLDNFFTNKSFELKRGFTHAITSPSNILEDYLTALKNHTQSGCHTCVCVHIEGQALYKELEDELAQALDEVSVSSNKDLWSFTSPTGKGRRMRRQAK
jgi:hypothetical protein